MLSSRQRLCLVGCLCVQFQRQFCLIPELPIPSYLSPLLQPVTFSLSCSTRHLQSTLLVPDAAHPCLFQMWRSLFRVLSFQHPWLSCLVPTLMSFWAWIDLSSTRPRSIIRPRPCCSHMIPTQRFGTLVARQQDQHSCTL